MVQKNSTFLPKSNGSGYRRPKQSGNSGWRDKITFYNFKVFFNRDEKNGKNDAFEVKSTDDPEDFRRAWCEVGTSRTIFLNVGHVAYLALQDYSELQYNYLREQMLKQYVLLYLKEGKYDMFSEKSSDFIELEPQEAADRVLEKIERVYTKSLMWGKPWEKL